jgi:hypothetical protein
VAVVDQFLIILPHKALLWEGDQSIPQ